MKQQMSIFAVDLFINNLFRLPVYWIVYLLLHWNFINADVLLSVGLSPIDFPLKAQWPLRGGGLKWRLYYKHVFK